MKLNISEFLLFFFFCFFFFFLFAFFFLLCGNIGLNKVVSTSVVLRCCFCLTSSLLDVKIKLSRCGLLAKFKFYAECLRCISS